MLKTELNKIVFQNLAEVFPRFKTFTEISTLPASGGFNGPFHKKEQIGDNVQKLIYIFLKEG